MNSPSTALYFDQIFLHHDPGRGHPESPKRLEAIVDLLERVPIPALAKRQPRPATAEKGRTITDLVAERLAEFLVQLSASPFDERFPF